MRDCAETGIRYVWMRRGPGAGSVSAATTGYGPPTRDHRHRWRLSVTFNPTADVGCKAMRVVFTWTGKSRSRCETGASIAAYETRTGA